jgi:outer membrane protein assembly factor BamB
MTARRAAVLVSFATVVLSATVLPPGAAASRMALKPKTEAAPFVQTNWSERGFDPANTGFNPFENVIGLSNVSELSVAWSGPIGDVSGASPAEVDGVVYFGSKDKHLYAFDAAGVTNCSGTPKVCQPLWTAKTGRIDGTPAVANGVLYIGANGKLNAFDAAGVTNCSGTPKTCLPLWTSDLREISTSSPVVVDGVVYIGGGNAPAKLYAFDAAGVTNCSGTPKRCTPLWTGMTSGKSLLFSSPAVANGVVYMGSQTNHGGGFDAFDAAGVTHCSGTPKTCQPLWSADTGSVYASTPAVADGKVFITSANFSLFAFDAAGGSHCRGMPKWCKPLWTSDTQDAVNSPAVANGVVYVGSLNGVDAYGVAGVTNCSGSKHRRCSPLWTGPTAGPTESGLAIANGVLYVGTRIGDLYAFDADGVVNCSGGLCDPVWAGTTGAPFVVGPIVVNGVLFAATSGNLYAFSLP